jgi:hypothetical protein
MISLSWQKGPDLPQGFQDSCGGVVGCTLITCCGFCQGAQHWTAPHLRCAGKDHKYPRGFLSNAWGLDLRAMDAWVPLPPFPGTARQGACAAVVGEQLYMWGGLSYSPPYCYRDGYRLSGDGGWRWDRLPDLPHPLCGAGCVALGPQIYAFGGADYDAERFCTNGDCQGGNPRRGARLYAIDTRHLDRGWQELRPCEGGTPRWVAGTAAVDGRVHVIGGGTGGDNATGGYCTVVDNWRYDPGTDTWQRIADLPVASGNFPAGPIVYRDRYVLLVGGYQYARVMDPDGTDREPYGKPYRHYEERPYYSDVFVYDARLGGFGTADPLPLNNNMPLAIVEDSRLFLIGGEIDGAVVEGARYGHHPDLCLIGRIQAVDC